MANELNPQSPEYGKGQKPHLHSGCSCGGSKEEEEEIIPPPKLGCYIRYNARPSCTGGNIRSVCSRLTR